MKSLAIFLITALWTSGCQQGAAQQPADSSEHTFDAEKAAGSGKNTENATPGLLFGLLEDCPEGEGLGNVSTFKPTCLVSTWIAGGTRVAIQDENGSVLTIQWKGEGIDDQNLSFSSSGNIMESLKSKAPAVEYAHAGRHCASWSPGDPEKTISGTLEVVDVAKAPGESSRGIFSFKCGAVTVKGRYSAPFIEVQGRD